MNDERDLENGEMYEEEELDTIVLTLEDGGEIGCRILGVFEAEGYDSDYIVPASEGDNEIMIYKYEEINEEETSLDITEDDTEYEKAKETFESLFVDFDEEDEERFQGCCDWSGWNSSDRQ